jgi:hypothetical protein
LVRHPAVEAEENGKMPGQGKKSSSAGGAIVQPSSGAASRAPPQAERCAAIIAKPMTGQIAPFPLRKLSKSFAARPIQILMTTPMERPAIA